MIYCSQANMMSEQNPFKLSFTVWSYAVLLQHCLRSIIGSVENSQTMFNPVKLAMVLSSKIRMLLSVILAHISPLGFAIESFPTLLASRNLYSLLLSIGFDHCRRWIIGAYIYNFWSLVEITFLVCVWWWGTRRVLSTCFGCPTFRKIKAYGFIKKKSWKLDF